MHCMFAKHSHLYFPEAHVAKLRARAHGNSEHSSRHANCDICINLHYNICGWSKTELYLPIVNDMSPTIVKKKASSR